MKSQETWRLWTLMTWFVFDRFEHKPPKVFVKSLIVLTMPITFCIGHNTLSTFVDPFIGGEQASTGS